MSQGPHRRQTSTRPRALRMPVEMTDPSDAENCSGQKPIAALRPPAFAERQKLTHANAAICAQAGFLMQIFVVPAAVVHCH